MHSSEVEVRYLYVNKDCGSVAGVWPYANKQRKWICRTAMIFIAITSLITQIAKVIIDLSVDSLIEQCPFLVIALGIIIKETNYIIHEEELKSVFGFLFKDWMMDRPKDEFDIMDKYAKRGLFFSRLYVANGCFCYIIFTLVAVTPRILDIVSPRNESRGVGFIYPAYYALDEEEHYYIILAHMLSVITVTFFVYISCDSIYMTIIQHACGLLNVTGYRFLSAVQDTDKNGNMKVADEEYQKVCFSVKAHQHAMEYIGMIERMHDSYLFLVVTLIILSFSITLVKATTMEPSVEFYKYCGFLVVQLVHLLFLSIQGYFIIMAHDNVYNNIYNGLWYLSTAKTQALYALALRRNLTPPLLTAGGIMTLDLESFSEILKASVSYCTVLKSS
ncbi:uncharacterized protein LOC108627101 isoform X2 [Ceratina calcarata]|nr:uncharacterized protein LOC108627101 isoform X2 [Ceratina calcarata]XP_026671135.1 uncharacterized protein LOC108627101 isoform X2 [Ceratina calcarata]XP_026671136.1 uncharacterized protein LOC108627101 isoform X2 [Ceratina calcarata]